LRAASTQVDTQRQTDMAKSNPEGSNQGVLNVRRAVQSQGGKTKRREGEASVRCGGGEDCSGDLLSDWCATQRRIKSVKTKVASISPNSGKIRAGAKGEGESPSLAHWVFPENQMRRRTTGSIHGTVKNKGAGVRGTSNRKGEPPPLRERWVEKTSSL